jgi:hypothetical protein
MKYLINYIDEYLTNNIPFSFSRFNDGEVGGIVQSNFIASRGDQLVNSRLQSKLKSSIQHRQKNYWVGIPCPKCYPKFNYVAEELVGDYEYKTLAVDLINKNYQKTNSIFKKHFQNKNIHWIGNNEHNTDNFIKEYNILNFSINTSLPSQDAFSQYDNIKNYYENFSNGDVVLISLGPVERILAQEWFKIRPDVTFIGVGSFFDPLTRNISYGYHTKTTKKCQICN